MDRWPNFLIVGAQKAGTTSLFYYLRQHPKVFMPSMKEPGYFRFYISEEDEPKPIRDKKKYLALFKKVKDEIAIGEASGAYLEEKETPKRIHDVIPNARIIILLRDPVERSYSQYLEHVKGGIEKLSFSERIRDDLSLIKKNIHTTPIVRASFYSEKIKRYWDTFGKNQIKIIISEEFIYNTNKTVKDILKFLGIDGPLHDFNEESRNPYKVARGGLSKFVVQNKIIRKMVFALIPWETRHKFAQNILFKDSKKPEMLKSDKIFLEKLFIDDAKKTQDLIGRALPWPLLTKDSLQSDSVSK